MKPINQALLWAGESILYLIIMTLIYRSFPEKAVYWFIRKYTGVIQGETWDNYYFLALSILAFLLNILVIFIAASLIERKRNG